MEEFEYLGSNLDTFWHKYTNADGERATYQKILNRLKTERKEAEDTVHAQAAADARTFFGDDRSGSLATQVFRYRKNSRWHDRVTNKDIARQWHRLLETNAAVSSGWQARVVSYRRESSP